MAKASEALLKEAGSLETLGAVVAKAGSGRPPIHLWNPPFCGEIDMRIARDGTWFYQGTPIGRPAMVRLFASVLRREDDRHVLVTPVEKVGSRSRMLLSWPSNSRSGWRPATPFSRLRTNVDDWVTVDADHPLRFEPGAAEGLKPYVLVRDDLWALVSRALFYDLVERGELRQCDGVEMFGIASSGSFFPMAPADASGCDA